MCDICTMGEILVEIMRPKADMAFNNTAEFLGPFPSGAPAIFIDTAARLGHSAAIIGGVGSDEFGKCVLDRLKADGVDISRITVSHHVTGTAFVTYFTDGARKFIFHIDHTSAVEARCPDEADICTPKYFHVMGCSLTINKAFTKEIMKTVNMLHLKGAAISFDPNLRKELMNGGELQDDIIPLVKRCAVLMPGVSELLAISRQERVEDAVKSLFRNDSLKIIALKRGADGCTVYTREQSFDIPAYHIEQRDPTGAGDCFDAAFICGLIEGRPLKECAKMATAAGALNAAAFGPMEGRISKESINRMIAGV